MSGCRNRDQAGFAWALFDGLNVCANLEDGTVEIVVNGTMTETDDDFRVDAPTQCKSLKCV
jgi:hypothetical protein